MNWDSWGAVTMFVIIGLWAIGVDGRATRALEQAEKLKKRIDKLESRLDDR